MLTCSSVARLVVHLVFRFVGCFMMLTGVYWWWFLFAGCCLICCGCCGWLLTAWLSVLADALVWFVVCWYRLMVVRFMWLTSRVCAVWLCFGLTLWW